MDSSLHRTVSKSMTYSDADVAFNVRRCPFQEYYKCQGVPVICQYASCNLGYPLAKAWHATLMRSHTLAGDNLPCDFRFYVEKTS
ncbi:MAG: L-2-amino-thiazoline-4-carboxylic acid hydrolase [Proteobacteria bacterium]|nr:L-2-amino-thiazoline-4-carboxylic acid hydrolase [Pseudomonadota bacterium]